MCYKNIDEIKKKKAIRQRLEKTNPYLSKNLRLEIYKKV